MQEEQPLIADFGIALRSAMQAARHHANGLSLGHPQYMSPEQATGDRVVDGRTDIYSLGTITTRCSSVIRHMWRALRRRSSQSFSRETDERSCKSSECSAPCRRSNLVVRMEKLAADRFATAKEFADALEGKGAVVTSTTSSDGLSPR
jgi:serine/threonine-protein kinase